MKKNIFKLITCFLLLILILFNFCFNNIDSESSNKDKPEDINFEELDYSYSSINGSSLTLLITNTTENELLLDGFKILSFNENTNVKKETEVVIYAKLKPKEKINYVVDTKEMIVGDDITLKYIANIRNN